MKQALNRVFRKNWLIIAVILCIFVGIKATSVKTAQQIIKPRQYLDEWIAQCTDYSDAELQDFMAELVVQVGVGSEDESDDHSAQVEEYRIFINRYPIWKEFHDILMFARTGEGFLPGRVPPNFEHLQDFYAKMEMPQIIDNQPLDRYFDMQAFDITPILVLLLGISFWGAFYEQGIYKIAHTTLEGKGYIRSCRTALLVFALGLVCVNECIDWTTSGLLTAKNLHNATAQSYKEFQEVQAYWSIGQVLAFQVCSKLCRAVFLVLGVELLARIKKEVLGTAVWVVMFLLLTVVLGRILIDTPYASFLQFGLIQGESVIEGMRFLYPLPVTSALLGFILLAGMTAGTAIALQRGIGER